jgi:hypothetical protein
VDTVGFARRWVVAARLADGSLRYLCAPGTRRGGQDEWSPRIEQARTFLSEADAEQVAGGCTPNAAAKEYLAILRP